MPQRKSEAESTGESAVHAVVDLLRRLIATPSFSREEGAAADLVEAFFRANGIAPHRQGNNVWASSHNWNERRPTLLLNSHLDTVRPNSSWTRDPFTPTLEEGRLYGLGSNDAGGCLVSLIAAFLQWQAREDLPVNIVAAATAEEEISGAGGIASILESLPPLWAGIVGEPTSLRMAAAEKGLMVIDAEAQGRAGHAARDEGLNAIYIAMDDIAFLRDCALEKVSPLLGPVKISVTQIAAGSQHNVVPDRCRFVIDVRSNERYTNEEIFAYLRAHLKSHLEARSFRLRPSCIPLDHPLVKAGLSLGLPYFGSPTLSDQALLDFPTLKIGPGDSARSHTADEYIDIQEIEAGVETYARLIGALREVGPLSE
jgi:acetylornithine deacetylase